MFVGVLGLLAQVLLMRRFGLWLFGFGFIAVVILLFRLYGVGL